MKFKTAIIPTTAALSFALMLGSNTANASSILTNGSFEAPGGDDVRDQLTHTYLPGWIYTTNVDSPSYDAYESNNKDGLLAADGSHYVSFGHNGTVGGSISQVIKTTLGVLYTLSYQVAEQQGEDPSQVLRATVGGISNDNSNLTDSFVPGLSITFMGTGLDTVEFFDATPMGGGADSNLALDAVSISGGVGSVPEPGTWAMMLVGMAAIGLAIRRRAQGAIAYA